MAELKRTWSIATSPRSPYKLPDTIQLLEQFSGAIWNTETQASYAEKLAESEDFEGNVSATEPDFSARDRVNRAPKAFGFVRFDDDRKVAITPAGKKLLAGKRIEELFTRQLLKWQYPSSSHKNRGYANFNIKPFLEVLRLCYELDGINKKELAVFALPFTDYRKYKEVKAEIERYRQELSTKASRIEKINFYTETHTAKLTKIYAEDIEAKQVHIRERRGKPTDIATFLATKKRNTIDYADAAIRYFRATGLFTISSRNYRLTILENKKDAVKEILNTISRDPSPYANDKDFLDYLGNPDIPRLPSDNAPVLISEIKLLNKDPIQHLPELEELPVEKLKDIRDELETNIRNATIETEINELQTYKQLPDILEVFDRIQERISDIPDRPLFLEWNTWRAFNTLDDGSIEGNLRLDLEGKPLSTAPAKAPDLVCYYDKFVLVIEVTVSTGIKQYEMEGEPVARHIGDIKRLLKDKNDTRPVYGLFIANALSEALVAHFYMLRKTPVSFYGGKTNFVPVTVETIQKMLKAAQEAGGVKSSHLLSFVKWADEVADTTNEVEWVNTVQQKASEWNSV